MKALFIKNINLDILSVALDGSLTISFIFTI